jgi:hypothetical protein
VNVKRRIARILLLCMAALPCSGCVFLQNEFFVFDRLPPADLPVAGTEMPN